MKALSEEEIDEIIELAYNAAYESIVKDRNKKDFEDINIDIRLDSLDEGFDIDIEITLDSDMPLDENLSQEAVNKSLEAVDEYIERRNSNMDE